MPRPCSSQFRERVLGLLEEGRKVEPLADELGISPRHDLPVAPPKPR